MKNILRNKILLLSSLLFADLNNAYGFAEDFDPSVKIDNKTQIKATAYLNLANAKYNEGAYPEAFHHFDKSAKLGNLKAKTLSAKMLIDGYGVLKDVNQGIEILNKLSEQGYRGAQFELGYYYYLNRNWEQAFFWLNKAGDQNHKDALYLLGDHHLNSHSIHHDQAKGLKYLRRASDLGDGQSANRLANRYANLEGEDNLKLAIRYYLIAGNDQDCLSCQREAWRKLGSIFGGHPYNNFERAAEFLRLLGRTGTSDAPILLGDWILEGKIQGEVEEVIYWYTKASRFPQPDTEALFKLVDLYLSPAVNAPNLAVEWLEKATYIHHAQGRANTQLGNMYFDGNGVQQNYYKAVMHFKKVLGNSSIHDLFGENDPNKYQANLALAKCYAKGLGVRQDKLAAKRHLINACEYEQAEKLDQTPACQELKAR